MIRLTTITVWAGLLAGAAHADCRFSGEAVTIDAMALPKAVAALAVPQPLAVRIEEPDGLLSQSYLSPRESLALVEGRILESREDLDGDGQSERCFALLTPLTCSNGVVSCAHIVTDGSGELILLETATHQLTPLPWPVSGMPMIQSVTVRPDGNMYSQLFRFDAGRYHAQGGVNLGPHRSDDP